MNKKINKFLGFGIVLYSLSMLFSHISLFASMLGYFIDFLSGIGVGFIIIGLIPIKIKDNIKRYKSKII